MAVNRTIYTQGAVLLTGGGGTAFPACLTGAGTTLSGVQSANFTFNQPKQDVNAFGTLGPINKVQVEPSTATLEVSMIINSGNHPSTGWLSGLVADASRPSPSGLFVAASGVGHLTSGILTAFRMEVSVGALPTLNLTFDGIATTGVIRTGILAPAAQTTINTATVAVATPDNFGTIYWSGTTSSSTGCPQTIRASWEMPVERLNCLGTNVDTPAIFSRPPGTVSFTAEGIDYTLVNAFVTGVEILSYKLANQGAREVSRTVNLAIGESAATFNVTSETVALGATVTGPAN